jgi:hypothetical protein
MTDEKEAQLQSLLPFRMREDLKSFDSGRVFANFMEEAKC